MYFVGFAFDLFSSRTCDMFSAGNKELPPRFKNKILLAQQQGQGNLEDVSLRPAPMSMMFKQSNTKPVLLSTGMWSVLVAVLLRKLLLMLWGLKKQTVCVLS
jgi:hypothetical protein